MNQYEEKARQIVSQMSLAEKTRLLQGSDFWHMSGNERFELPSLLMTDGPYGLRRQACQADHIGLNESVPSTCFPASGTTACSFDTELLEEIGTALSEECLAEGVGILLGPAVNHQRSPLCGRNFEYISEDPYLSGRMGAAMVRGLQTNGTGACVKHFAANNQETRRMTSDSVVDERALHEIYLKPFEIIVRESRPWAIMTSYNRVNGVYSSEHKDLLQNTARKKWGFQGIFVTDWGALNDVIPGFLNGLDLEMPGVCPGTDEIIAEAVRNGTFPEEILDGIAIRLVTVLLQQKDSGSGKPYDVSAHLELAQKAAAESAVLLKNDNETLPLRPDSRIALIGLMAKMPRYQGGGSSHVNSRVTDNLADALPALGYSCDYAQGYLEDGSTATQLLEEAVNLSKDKDAAVIVCGLPESYESEGYDRSDLSMPEGHLELISKVCAVNPRTVVILQCGSPVLMPWFSKVGAVLYAGLSGSQGGKAIASLLAGIHTPCGKLAQTWPLRTEDTPCHSYYLQKRTVCEYRESIFTGYRYYDTAGIPVQFPFGFGLSYTNFVYSDMTVSDPSLQKGCSLKVSLTVTNTGQYAGKEIVQIYVGQNSPKMFKPKKELRAFQKVFLEPSEQKRLSFILPYEAFSSYDSTVRDWITEEGIYTICAGASVEDIREHTSIRVNGDISSAADYRADAGAYYDLTQIHHIPDRDFSFLLHRKIPVEHMPCKPYDHNITLGELAASSRFYSLTAGLLERVIRWKITDPETRRQAQVMLMDLPARNIGMAGGINKKGIQGIVDIINGHLIRGLRRIIRS